MARRSTPPREEVGIALGGEQTNETPTKTALWAHIRKYALRYFVLIGLAMQCAAEMEGVIKVSSWIGYLTRYYRRVSVVR